MMDGATVLHCSETRSGWFENNGKGQFTFHPFPLQAQIAPVNAAVVTDVNNDGIKDIILAGNDYEASVMPGAYDASYGLLLTGKGKGIFDAVAPVQSNFIVDGDVRDLKMVKTKDGKLILCGINNAAMKTFRVKKNK
jgi:enediyne biosynthesis protein E4